MGDTNYFLGTVKILKTPKRKLVKNKMLRVMTRVEIPQMRESKSVLLVLWGRLGNEIKNFYRVHDYILVEGYISINKTNLKLNKIIITGLKIYPILLESSSRSGKK